MLAEVNSRNSMTCRWVCLPTDQLLSAEFVDTYGHLVKLGRFEKWEVSKDFDRGFIIHPVDRASQLRRESVGFDRSNLQIIHG